MIRILGKNEAAAEHASDLVGRFVGKEGVMKFRSYSWPALVTGYSGNRLYVTRAQVDSNALGTDGPFLLPLEDWDQEDYMQMKSVAYVCDTIEDCERMMLASRKALRIWQEGQARIKQKTDEVFDALSLENEEAPTP